MALMLAQAAAVRYAASFLPVWASGLAAVYAAWAHGYPAVTRALQMRWGARAEVERCGGVLANAFDRETCERARAVEAATLVELVFREVLPAASPDPATWLLVVLAGAYLTAQLLKRAELKRRKFRCA